MSFTIEVLPSAAGVYRAPVQLADVLVLDERGVVVVFELLVQIPENLGLDEGSELGALVPLALHPVHHLLILDVVHDHIVNHFLDLASQVPVTPSPPTMGQNR